VFLWSIEHPHYRFVSNNFTFTSDEIVSPGSDVTYLVTIDNDSNAPVTVSSLTDDVYSGVVCRTAAGANVIGSVLAADDGDAKLGPGHFNGGADEIQCEFVESAPANHGVKVTDTVTVEVQDDSGQTGTNTAASTITTN
jgi:uncharacterized repeat protein (TIGR01451 family)